MRTDKATPTTTSPDMLYAMEAVETMEEVKSSLGRLLRTLAMERATRGGRRLVTGEDVMDSVDQALEDMLRGDDEDPNQAAEGE